MDIFLRNKDNINMFLEEKHKKHINNVIQNVYSNLNGSDLKFLQEKTHDLINYIHIKFIIKTIDNERNHPKKSNDFFEQLTRNNNREIIAIMNLLLPFIDDKNLYEKHKLIKEFKDISKLAEKEENNITNYQYSRGYYDNEKKTYI